MATIWHIRGKKAGAFEEVPEEDAKKAVESGDAQIADGAATLAYPQGHPHYDPNAVVARKTAEKKPVVTKTKSKKYPDKMLTAEDE